MIRTGKAGSGTYGIVYTAETTDESKRKIAVKRNVVDNSVNFSGSIKELDLLNRLRGHPYIVKLLSVSFNNPFAIPNSPIGKPGNYDYREDYLHFIFEQARTNGHDLIHNPDLHVSYLKLAILQMFIGLEYMHSKNIIHRDIKPANILWFVSSDNKAAAKLCDFGLSRVVTPHDPMTPRVVTCWYRAPEVCSRDPNYTFASDVWSAGCVMFEMISKKPLLAGCPDNDTKLLSKIIGTVPEVTYEEINKLTKNHEIKLTKDASPRTRPSFKELMGLSDNDIMKFNQYPASGSTYDQFLDLLSKILTLDPDKRYSATQVLDHKFFEPYKAIINWSREKYPPVPPIYPNINIVNCYERGWAAKTAFLIFNARGHLEWYKHKILFQSIDMFDRYLYHVKTITNKEKVESKYHGKYMSRYQAELRYVVCLYMAIKYFTTLHIPISFHELASDNYKTEKAMIEAEEFEKEMLRDVLKYDLYRDTVYEISCEKKGERIDEYETRDLLSLYGNIKQDYFDIGVVELLSSLE